MVLSCNQWLGEEVAAKPTDGMGLQIGRSMPAFNRLDGSSSRGNDVERQISDFVSLKAFIDFYIPILPAICLAKEVST